VEVWVTFLSAPYFFAAVAVSPPPITVTAPFCVALTIASAISLVAFSKAANSNTPAGPFQTMVLESKMALTKSSVDFAPTSKPIQPSGIPVESLASFTAASAANLSAII